MTIYLIEGTQSSYDDAEQYFINYSGFNKHDAVELFRNEDAEFIMDNCPDIEILTNTESV
jgi:hypothetical protein